MGVRIPSYRHHKPSGRAVVTISGHDHYLGPYGSAESRERYGRLIAQHAAGQTVDTSAFKGGESGLTVNELVLAFLQHAKKHYARKSPPASKGRRASKRETTCEYDCCLSAVRPLLHLYGDFLAKDFGPLALKTVRERMIELKWCRNYINKSIGRVRRVFRFGISNELLEPSVLQKLEAVEPLLEGRCDAVESTPRSVVPDEHIEAVRNVVNQRTRDMMDLALLTGARPGELCMLTGEMINMTGDVWTAELKEHKTAHKGKRRVLAFGPKAQAILQRYQHADKSLGLFQVTRGTFSNNIKYACEKLGLPRFTGHWLRHNAGSEVRERCGLDGAQVLLGHASAKTTEIYAHLDKRRVVEIARTHG